MGLSVRQLVVVFLAGVAVCALFFSLGFLVGYNERASSGTPTVDRVPPPGENPPPVGPPPESGNSRTSTPATATTSSTASEEVFGTVAGPSKSSTGPATPGSAFQGSASIPQGGTVTEPASLAAAGRQAGTGITIQVAASHARQDAEALVDVLKGRGYPVFVMTPENAHTNDGLFRVQVGPFASRADAERIRQKLVQEGFKPFVRIPADEQKR